MADVSAHTPIFSRGSTVLDYWLVHAKGLTVQPSGERVEEVVAAPPIGRPETLIVRSRMTRRRRAIPAESIAAVEPSLGHLLLEPPVGGAATRFPRPAAKQLVAARANAARGGRIAQAQAAGAVRFTQARSRSAIAWLHPRALQAGAATARHTRFAAARTAMGIGWLAPRVLAGVRAAGATGVRLALAAAVIAARAAARAARWTEHGAATMADRGRASLEARRARQRQAPDD
jgi:hypothetical protein